MHRDISPDNLLIDSEGVLKIIDFDSADFVDPLIDNKLDIKVGTLGYRSPELFLKQKRHDFRTDVYSAGCILADILFKKAPFFIQNSGEKEWH
jgi:serine/threonine protein kinase